MAAPVEYLPNTVDWCTCVKSLKETGIAATAQQIGSSQGKGCMLQHPAGTHTPETVALFLQQTTAHKHN